MPEVMSPRQGHVTMLEVMSPCQRSRHHAGGHVTMPEVTSPHWRSCHHVGGHATTLEVMPHGRDHTTILEVTPPR